MDYTFRLASKDDIDSVFHLYETRVQWMEHKGLRQWNTTNYLSVYSQHYFQKQLEEENLYVFERISSGKIIGAVVLLQSDERWDECEKDKAYYIHNLVTDSFEKGIGMLILNKIEKLAIRDGKRYLRLDCADDSEFLNSYYENMGYLAIERFREGSYIGIKREKQL